mgnify:FL=1|jgi:hypothetical protein|tara:strand:+ start:144 stop:353 length:210 start_codon:yes stop_codon:yes gene_type:complete
MNKEKLYQANLKLINPIQKIRSKNNVNWMNIIKLAFRNESKATSKIMPSVYVDDKKTSSLVKKLTKLNK